MSKTSPIRAKKSETKITFEYKVGLMLNTAYPNSIMKLVVSGLKRPNNLLF
jgi:hypothetical protein